jgi:hypothetical protein
LAGASATTRSPPAWSSAPPPPRRTSAARHDQTPRPRPRPTRRARVRIGPRHAAHDAESLTGRPSQPLTGKSDGIKSSTHTERGTQR